MLAGHYIMPATEAAAVHPIKSGDPKAIAEIVRDLHRAPGDAEASFSEKTIYQQAWDHLIPEIAAVDRIDLEAAAKKGVALLEAA
jgi:CarD family transcriptional regulator